MSWRLAPSTARPTGTPWASVNRLRLTPRLPRSVGLAPVFSPAQGRFGQGSVHAHPTPVQTLQFVIAFQSHPPQLQKHPSGNPFLKAQMGGGTGTDAGGVQGFPLVAGAQHVADAIGAGTVGNPRPAPAEPMGVHTRGIRGASTSHSSSEIWNAPVVGLVLVAGPARFGRGGLGSFALIITPV